MAKKKQPGVDVRLTLDKFTHRRFRAVCNSIGMQMSRTANRLVTKWTERKYEEMTRKRKEGGK